MDPWHIIGFHGTPTHHLILCYTIMGIIFLFLQKTPLANPLSFNYTSFKIGDVILGGDASIVRGVIQVTMNSMDQSNNYSVGRVTSNNLMHLWDKQSGNLSDFTTTFSFVIFSDRTAYGDGMAFFLADPNLPLHKVVREGGGLGLVDGDQVLNSTQHSFMAVEFDTFTNSWDPQDQGIHLGLNFNSMRSSITKPWMVDIIERRFYSCSIEYNSSTLNLSVSYTVSDDEPAKYISYKVDLRGYLPEWVTVGFSAATGRLVEVNALQSWSFSSSSPGVRRNVSSRKAPSPATQEIPVTRVIPGPISGKGNKPRLLVGLGIGISLVVSLLVLVCVSLWTRSRWKKEELAFDLIMDDEFKKGSGPKRFPYKELANATNNFAEPNKLGQGGFGSVYKGHHLKNSDPIVAIKKISRESRQGIKEYATEVKIISQLRHRNLVQLIGWCHKKNDLLLVYEFMPNGSLDSHLYGGKSPLTWTIRYNIALGLASALLYLQEEWEQCVIHRDIKSSNIMLDSLFNAKLGDFGLARLVDHEKGSKTTQIAGTRGYIAPEYIASGKATKESDIYSFGIVLLEIVSGKKPIDLEHKDDLITIVEWVWELYGVGKSLEVADPKLCGDFDEQQMKRAVCVGLWCVHPDYSFRPCIRKVIQVLKFEAPLPMLPEKMPVPTYLPPSIRALFPLSSSYLVVGTRELLCTEV